MTLFYGHKFCSGIKVFAAYCQLFHHRYHAGAWERWWISSSHDDFVVLLCNTYHYTEVGIMSITSIRIADDVEKPLEALSKKLDRSKNYLINQAIKEFIVRQSLEDSRWQDTLKALESIKAGQSIDEAYVNAWLN
jgi:predicted transcriptional regulator